MAKSAKIIYVVMRDLLHLCGAVLRMRDVVLSVVFAAHIDGIFGFG